MPAETFQPIYLGRDFYVPAFNVKVQGQQLEKEIIRDIMEVRYSDSIDKIDTFELTVNNWDASKRIPDFKYTGPKNGTDDKRIECFLPGKDIELWMGYLTPRSVNNEDANKPGPLQLMLAGQINKLAPTFPQDGRTTLKVSGQNILCRLSAVQKTAYYDQKTASVIAREVGDRGDLKLNNMKVEVEVDKKAKANEAPLERILQYNQYDIVFLLQLARRCGYDLFLQDKSKGGKTEFSLLFGPAVNGPRPSYTIEWGRSLIQFQPTLTTANQVKELTVRGWNVNKKEKIEVTVNRNELGKRPLRDKNKLKTLEEGFSEKKEIVVDTPLRSVQEAREHAKALLGSIVGKMVTAKGSTIGTPDLRAGSRVEIAGLGMLFNGTYTVTATSHSIGPNGYITEFDARLEEKN